MVQITKKIEPFGDVEFEYDPNRVIRTNQLLKAYGGDVQNANIIFPYSGNTIEITGFYRASSSNPNGVFTVSTVSIKTPIGNLGTKEITDKINKIIPKLIDDLGLGNNPQITAIQKIETELSDKGKLVGLNATLEKYQKGLDALLDKYRQS